MCVYNAKRDNYILAPISIESESGKSHWDPLTGKTLQANKGQVDEINADIAPTEHALKNLKGRVKKQVLDAKNSAKRTRKPTTENVAK